MEPTSISDYEKLVREDLEDFAPGNRLLDFEEEFGPKAIQRALQKALNRFNRTPPNIGTFDFSDMPFSSLLVDMTILALIQRAVFKRARNALNYADAGLSIDDQNWAGYRAMANDLAVQVKQELTAVKAELNLKRGFKRVSSIYRYK